MIPQIRKAMGEPVVISGNAYDFGHRITAVEFSLDNGAHWTTYGTDGTNDYQSVQWRFVFTPEAPGFYVLKVRSVNDEGKTSPESDFVEIVIEEA